MGKRSEQIPHQKNYILYMYDLCMYNIYMCVYYTYRWQVGIQKDAQYHLS